MPARNKRGPLGEGPRTGHGRGDCGHRQGRAGRHLGPQWTGASTLVDDLPELDLSRITIAVPTMDGVNVSPHLGRSSAFVLVEIEQGEVKSRREATLSAGPHGGAHHDHGAHHATIRDSLEGASVVLALGAGRRIVADLELADIHVESATAPTIDASIDAFLQSKRSPVTGCGGRGHGHHHAHEG